MFNLWRSNEEMGPSMMRDSEFYFNNPNITYLTASNKAMVETTTIPHYMNFKLNVTQHSNTLSIINN